MQWGSEEVLYTMRFYTLKMKEEFRLTEVIEMVLRKQSLYWSRMVGLFAKIHTVLNQSKSQQEKNGMLKLGHSRKI